MTEGKRKFADVPVVNVNMDVTNDNGARQVLAGLAEQFYFRQQGSGLARPLSVYCLQGKQDQGAPEKQVGGLELLEELLPETRTISTVRDDRFEYGIPVRVERYNLKEHTT